MADYFPVLSRAVSALPTNTGESRRAVYERARAAVVKQLRSLEPPLSEEDISRERMQLEDAIGRVETEHGGAAAEPKPAPRPAPAPSAGPRIVPPAPPQAQVPRPATAPDMRREPEVRREPETRREPELRGGPEQRPAHSPKRGPDVRADGRPIIRATDAPEDLRRSRRSAPLVALAALVVIGVGVGAFLGRNQISALIGGAPSNQTATTTGAPSGATGDIAAAPDSGAKSDDRLLSDPAPAAQPQTDVARAPDQAPTTTPPAQTSPVQTSPAQTTPAETSPATTPPAPDSPSVQTQTPQSLPSQTLALQTPSSPQPPTTQPGALVAQRAILYEEGSDQQSGEQVDGTVVWRTESVNGGQNQPLETALRGDISIPGRDIGATVTIRRNIDATLPASHTIEIVFKLPANFPNAGVANVPGILMKVDEAARGSPVSGLSVRVTNGFFLIGLSNIDNERIVNEQLLRDRNWIDIPILYDNGRRAVLTLEKGTPGMQAFNDALVAWQTAAAAQRP